MLVSLCCSLTLNGCSVILAYSLVVTGWSSINPTLTYDRYGIPCNVLSEGDLCLPPDHPDANPTDDVFHTIQGYSV